MNQGRFTHDQYIYTNFRICDENPVFSEGLVMRTQMDYLKNLKKFSLCSKAIIFLLIIVITTQKVAATTHTTVVNIDGKAQMTVNGNVITTVYHGILPPPLQPSNRILYNPPGTEDFKSFIDSGAKNSDVIPAEISGRRHQEFSQEKENTYFSHRIQIIPENNKHFLLFKIKKPYYYLILPALCFYYVYNVELTNTLLFFSACAFII